MSVSRRTEGLPVLAVGDLVLDTMSRSLTGPTGTIKLEASAYLVLRALMSRPGAVVTMPQLISVIWPDPGIEPERNPEQAVRQRVFRARAALERVGVPGRRLVCQFQEGYVLVGELRIARVYSPAQAAALDHLPATHPDRVTAMVLVP